MELLKKRSESCSKVLEKVPEEHDVVLICDSGDGVLSLSCEASDAILPEMFPRRWFI